MTLLLPCENEISAHLLRSRLLSHGIPGEVVHDTFATMYGNWLTRPQLLIAADALEDGLELLAAPDEPLDETFIEPAATADASEDLGLRSYTPGFLPLIAFGCAAGFLLGTAGLFFLTLFTIVIQGSREDNVTGLTVPLLPLSWSLYGIFLESSAGLSSSSRAPATGGMTARSPCARASSFFSCRKVRSLPSPSSSAS